MHTEADFRKIAKELLEHYGRLTTKEIVKLISENITFDKDDLKPNPLRKGKNFVNGEPYVYQRIRNIALRCKRGNKKVYEEGFLIDRTNRGTYWIVTEGLSNKESIPNISVLNEKRKKYENRNKSKKNVRKIDWSNINEKNTYIGARGEEFVFEKEKETVKSFSTDSLSKVIHSSIVDGDGLGYDVLSINKRGESIYIEVKTTSGDEKTPFYMSVNERNFLLNTRNAFLYRVYNFDASTLHGNIKKYKGNQLEKVFIFDPVSFKVIKK